MIASPAFESRKIYEGGLVAIKMKKQNISLNRPIYVGFSVLELSKYIMYDFWYNHIKKEFGDRVKLIYTDTDSLVFEVTMVNEKQDIYEFVYNHKTLYDFSEYPSTHFCYDTTNEKVTGKFKDQTQGRAITEFVALTSKMYAFQLAPLATQFIENPADVKNNHLKETKTYKKAKGVTKNVTEKSLSFDNYKNCLFNQQTYSNEQTLLRSKDHKIGFYKQLKSSLTPIDTKRYNLDNGIDTLAFGHYKISEMEEAKLKSAQELLPCKQATILEESTNDKGQEHEDILSMLGNEDIEALAGLLTIVGV